MSNGQVVEIFPPDAHSGARFFLTRENSTSVLIKRFPEVDQSVINTLEKQKSFQPFQINDDTIKVRAARILDTDIESIVSTREARFVFERAVSGSKLLQSGNPREIQMLVHFMNDIVASAMLYEQKPFPVGTAISKIDEVFDGDILNCLLPDCKTLSLTLRQVIGLRELCVCGVGGAHGDLTLSNIMIDEECREIVLIDFIAGYHDFMTIDFAKLLQEFRYGWTSRHFSKHDKTRAKIIYDYVWPRDSWASLPEWFKLSVEVELAMTLLRIAPYVRHSDKQTQKWLIDAVNAQNNILLGVMV